MRIFYDHQIFSLQRFGGASRIFAELIGTINTDSADQAHLSLLASQNAHLKEKGVVYPSLLDKVPLLNRQGVIPHINHLYTLADIRLRKFDLYHATYYNPTYLKKAGKKPVVVTFLDMIHERFRDEFPEIAADDRVIRMKREIIGSATHAIAISESTKRDMIDIYGVDPAKITVAHLGSSFLDKEPAPKAEGKTEVPYLLYVGTRDAYKNFKPMLTAIAEILRKGRISLICAGGRGFTIEEQKLIAALRLTGLVKHQSIDDSTLRTLYNNAMAFVFPSLYEGFGIPILEAFSCNCPCVISNTSSLPEVGGEAALYMELAKKGKERQLYFSWQKMTQETLAVYRQLLS